MTFPARTSLTRVEVLTGKTKGENRLAYGTLEVSADGTNFFYGTGFTNGVAQLEPVPSPLMALRVRASGGSDAVLSIREFRIEGPQSRPAIRLNAASREHCSVADVFQQETGQSVDNAWALFVASRRASQP